MKNKGFSMVELIIVIAIIALLSGALAPALVKYINKARLSTDIDTGKEIAKALMTNITNEAVRDNAVAHTTPQPVSDMDGNDFKNAVYEMLGVSDIKGKSTRDADGNDFDSDKRCFYYTLDADKNKVEVYYGGITADYQIYPTTGSKLVK